METCVDSSVVEESTWSDLKKRVKKSVCIRLRRKLLLWLSLITWSWTFFISFPISQKKRVFAVRESSRVDKRDPLLWETSPPLPPGRHTLFSHLFKTWTIFFCCLSEIGFFLYNYSVSLRWMFAFFLHHWHGGGVSDRRKNERFARLFCKLKNWFDRADIGFHWIDLRKLFFFLVYLGNFILIFCSKRFWSLPRSMRELAAKKWNLRFFSSSCVESLLSHSTTTRSSISWHLKPKKAMLHTFFSLPSK